MLIIAIDPGTSKSAFVELDDAAVLRHGIQENAALLEYIRDQGASNSACLAVEMVACYGMAVGAETFETVYWIGRFIEAWERASGRTATRIFRKDIKLHFCGSARAKDANIRQAIIDRYGPGNELAIGKKKNPGPLYGVASHEWSALAVGVYHGDVSRTANSGCLVQSK